MLLDPIAPSAWVEPNPGFNHPTRAYPGRSAQNRMRWYV
jgi:hypothetical protein